MLISRGGLRRACNKEFTHRGYATAGTHTHRTAPHRIHTRTHTAQARSTRRYSRRHTTGLPNLSCAHSRYAPAVPRYDAPRRIPENPPAINRLHVARCGEYRGRHTRGRASGQARHGRRRDPVRRRRRRRAKPRNIRDGRRRHQREGTESEERGTGESEKDTRGGGERGGRSANTYGSNCPNLTSTGV